MLPSIYSTNRNHGFFPSLFNDFLNDSFLMPQFHSTSPAINVSEDEKGYQVEIAAPGMTKEDFKISLAGDDIVKIQFCKHSIKRYKESEQQRSQINDREIQVFYPTVFVFNTHCSLLCR